MNTPGAAPRQPHGANPEFNSAMLERFRATLAKYEQPASALLPTLYLAQEQFGFLSREVMEYVAKLLGLPPAHVFEAASFYVMFKKKDLGQYVLQICTNITCTMMGAPEFVNVVREELGIGLGQVTQDQRFGCIAVQCVGACDGAPVLQVNDEFFEKYSVDGFRELVRRWKAGETPTPREQL